MAGWNQLPRSAEIVGAAIESLQANRPSAFPFANNGLGRYADLIAGWDAQTTRLLVRLAAECAAKRLSVAKGDDLTDLTRSEFNTDRDNAQTTAVGQILTVARGTNTAGAGAILKGARLKRSAAPTQIPPVPAAEYVVTQDTPFPYNALSISNVPIVCTQAGAAGNQIDLYNTHLVIGGLLSVAATPLVFIDTPFDPTIYVPPGQWECSGGADVKDDADLQNEAYAYAVGQYGPTIGSVLAGAFRGTGVRHAAVFDVAALSSGAPAAFTGVLVADASWGGFSSATPPSWLSLVQQQLQDPVDGFLGVGPQAFVSAPSNQLVTVTCTVMLQDAAYLAFTGDITSSIQAALRSYFDDRPDWYTFRLAGIRAVIAKCDPRIRACVTAAVLQPSNGVAIAEPPAVPSAFSTGIGGITANHFYLGANSVTPSFLAPT